MIYLLLFTFTILVALHACVCVISFNRGISPILSYPIFSSPFILCHFFPNQLCFKFP